jgi:hypothetical protein
MPDLDKEARRGTEAARLLDEPLVKEAFETLEGRLIAAWRTEKNPERREELWHELGALSKLRGHLKELVQTGAMARQQIAALNE